MPGQGSSQVAIGGKEPGQGSSAPCVLSWRCRGAGEGVADDTGAGAEPGWYPDPQGAAQFRYWNGICWTGWTEAALSMLPPPPSARSELPPPPTRPTSLPEAFNAPGASARAKAAEIKAAAPPRGFLARLFGGPTEDRNWTQGAAGEERVAQRLAKLPQPPWTVLHDLPIGTKGANIDHLVVGPAGVFTLNTKNLTGRIWVAGGTFKQNGQNRPYIPAASREAKRAARCLLNATGIEVPVFGIVVVMADELTVKRQPDDVRVLTRRQVTRWLAARPAVLGPDLVDQVAQAARVRSTWA